MLTAEIHATPPGLEELSRLSLLEGQGDLSAAALDEELKATLVKEVTEVVKDHVEKTTGTVIESLWAKGQKAMQSLREQQANEMTLLQSQVEACTEAHRQIEKENQQLQDGLKALMSHLTLIFGTPPMGQAAFPMPPAMAAAAVAQAAPSSGPPAASPAAVAAAAAAASRQLRRANSDGAPPAPTRPQAGGAAASAAGTGGGRQLKRASSEGTPPLPKSTALLGAAPPTAEADTRKSASLEKLTEEEEATEEPGSSRGASPDAEARDGAASPASSQRSASAGGEKETPKAASVPDFSIGLRRAENVPLGLDVQDVEEGKCLAVLKVKPGGAVEAWNRQCAGDYREIRSGDIICQINDAEDSQSMMHECTTKMLLRLKVRRPGGSLTNEPPPLRADAVEFVPTGVSGK